MVKAIFWGILQGITEFLPISSSGHLIIFSWLFKERMPLDYVAFLHGGTLLALLFYFGKEWFKFIRAGILSIKEKNINSSEKKIFWLILLATLPGAVLGKMSEAKIEKIFYHPLSVALNMGGFAILFYFIEKISRKNKSIESLNIYQAFFIGIMQALAVIPGISRSGITIAGGLLLGLSRENAVKFSFYLSAPIILGAFLLKYVEFFEGRFSHPLVLGFFSSLLAGLCSIHFLIRFVQKHSFNIFIIYRLIISILVITIFLL